MKAGDILRVLDDCCNAFTFPMLDNGYVFLAATRLSVHRSPSDWGLVIEVFGYSPRAGIPDTHVCTFSSRPDHRKHPESYVNRQAYENYLAQNPHNASSFVHPIEEGDWLDADEGEVVSESAREIVIRSRSVRLPSAEEVGRLGVPLTEAPRIRVFELSRYLAAVFRNDLLATESERRMHLRPEMEQLLLLDEWHHPNVVDAADRPSGSQTFQQLAKVLETGDVRHYSPTMPPNTHWVNWPDGGSL